MISPCCNDDSILGDAMAKLLKFYRERRARWRRLGQMLERFDANTKLTADGADELYRLYRLASCDLAFMQTHTGNPALLDHLEDLVARAHAALTPPPETNMWSDFFHTLRYRFPEVVRREWKTLVLVVLIFLAGGAFGAVAVTAYPESAETFLAAFPNLLEQTPAEDAARRSNTSIGLGSFITFSLQLFTHNLRISLLCFALGLTFGIGTAIVLFANGAVLGCVAMMYARDGVFAFFLSWVGPHGSLELPSIILSATAGFMMARAQLSGGGSIWRAVAARRRDMLAIMAGTAVLLAAAGFIEGGLSQTHTPYMIPLKIGVAICCFAGLLAWLFVLPGDKQTTLSAKAI